MTEVEAEERQQNILVDLLRFEEGISAGVANLSHGVTERRAKQLWAVYDADGSGALDLSEVATLVKDMATATIKRVVRKIDALQAATDTPAASASLFASFDTSGDGQVQREEFVAAATKGVQVLHGVVDDEDDAASVSKAASDLGAGVTEETAERLWHSLDTDRNGLLDRAEVHAIFARQVGGVIKCLRAQVSRLGDITRDETWRSTSAKVMSALDTNGDGKVQQDEFVRLATKGIEIDFMSEFDD